jgi:peptide/nickel transport system ATP-binding protein/oligopeptide transport system ATP-binding protein|tara:strand:- start:10739 stop:11728 length:990 start_codon:yes stop_codon:yes gene_type:complete
VNSDTTPILEVTDLKKHFPVRRGVFGRVAGHVHAVDGVTFAIGEGETLGLVGESGCGKSTVGRTVLRLHQPTAGSIRLAGEEITALGNRALRPHRRRMQIIFQDPFSSLDPRMSAGEIVGELLDVHGVAAGTARKQRIAELFEYVGLRTDQLRNYPHEFSGGQRQRLGIARALSLSPNLIICDEPVSALDVSIQAQVINLLMDLQQEFALSYLFIAHDLAVVEHISDHVAVMYLGRIVEFADKRELFANPQHPYTESLLAAVPVPDPNLSRSAQGRRKQLLQGDVPSPISRPTGCHFHTRCPYATDRCKAEDPLLKEVTDGHQVACHLR